MTELCDHYGQMLLIDRRETTSSGSRFYRCITDQLDKMTQYEIPTRTNTDCDFPETVAYSSNSTILGFSVALDRADISGRDWCDWATELRLTTVRQKRLAVCHYRATGKREQ